MFRGTVVRFGDCSSVHASAEAVVAASDEGAADSVWGSCGGWEDGGDPVGRRGFLFELSGVDGGVVPEDRSSVGAEPHRTDPGVAEGFGELQRDAEGF